LSKQEQEKTDKVESFLKSRGYTTQRETIPIECEKWEYPYKVDLIFYKNPNDAIGVEFKDASLRSGGKIAQAFQQVQQYRKLNYRGIKVTKWCICPSFGNNDGGLDGFMYTVVQDFVQKFINYFEIGYFWTDFNQIIIDSFTKGRIDIK
jgi:hypothetical protein